VGEVEDEGGGLWWWT